MSQTVGILHPGSMGAAVASCAAANADQVLWCSAGRSPASTARAQRYGLAPVATLRELVDRCDTLISLCPPAAAEDVAREAAGLGFAGVYVEANAINPERAGRIAALLGEARAVVDGGVVGGPPTGGSTPTLLLSGPPDAAAEVAALFAGTAVRTTLLGPGVGPASALKLSYATFQKTSRVLVALSYALARAHGVDHELPRLGAGTYLADPGHIPSAAARAWRWGPEMEEAADTLAAAGLPPELLRAAASTLTRWDLAKDNGELSLDEALGWLRER